MHTGRKMTFLHSPWQSSGLFPVPVFGAKFMCASQPNRLKYQHVSIRCIHVMLPFTSGVDSIDCAYFLPFSYRLAKWPIWPDQTENLILHR